MSGGKFNLNYISKLEIKGTLLCSVASEDLAIDISSVEVVPIFGVTSNIRSKLKVENMN